MICDICGATEYRHKMLYLNLSKQYFVCRSCVNRVVPTKDYNFSSVKMRTQVQRDDFRDIVQKELEKYDDIIE